MHTGSGRCEQEVHIHIQMNIYCSLALPRRPSPGAQPWTGWLCQGE